MQLVMMIVLVVANLIYPASRASLFDETTFQHIRPYHIAATKKEKQWIDLNQADMPVLRQIKGIGPKKAQAIIDYRTEHGRFQTLEDIKSIKGIGAKLFKQLRKSLMVTSP
jgi:comEA protein